MSNQSYLISVDSWLQLGEVFRLAGDEGRHAATVKRTEVGEGIDLCTGQGVRASGVVIATGKDWIDVEVQSITTEQVPDPQVTVVQALAKGDRAELALEMLTEVGVDVIVPWKAARSVVKWDNVEKALEKWRKTIRESTKQSRRAFVASLKPLHQTDEVISLLKSATLAVVLHESATKSLANLQVPSHGEVVVVVGPEGGLTVEELTQFEAAGAHVVCMGSTVMRTSTAGAVAVGVLASKTSRWN